MGNVLRFPYLVARRQVVEKLVQAGYLPRARRHDADAVEEALNALREHSKNFFEKYAGKDDPTPAA